jgi:hypothetical protein
MSVMLIVDFFIHAATITFNPLPVDARFARTLQ